ncbi:hypothetical protein [Desulfofustis phage LS06-2018-MD01]|nr:hypothetical protein [Desulfofustis phage LS06-2018-MD01]
MCFLQIQYSFLFSSNLFTRLRSVDRSIIFSEVQWPT